MNTADPDAEVIALSPKTLMATNRFICEVCNKGFQREQNLQLHRRGHNLPWKLKQKNNKEVVKRKVYLCPEPTCVHHDPSRALGDLTGIKKHYYRKHGEKKWKCDKCSKRYAVQSDWKAHSKTCGTREYRCDCGTLFSRRDSFITHRAFCDALAQESARNPPPPSLSSIGSHLYAGGAAPNNMSLGISSSSITHDHTAADILRLGGGGGGGGGGGQFDHLLPPALGGGGSASSFRNPHLSSSSSSAAGFFMQDSDHHHQNQNNYQQYHHALMQQFSAAADPNNVGGGSGGSGNLFNLGFLPNSSIDNFNNNQGGGGGGGGGEVSGAGDHHHHQQQHNQLMGSSTSSMPLFNSSSIHSHQQQQQQMSNMVAAHMSATALLQKAAQMGSTTSSNPNATSSASLLRSAFGGAPALGGFGSSFFGDADANNGSNNLHDLMNSFAAPANNNSSIFSNNKLLSGTSAGSDRLTRDFLGVGHVAAARGIATSTTTGGFSAASSQSHQHQHQQQQLGGLERSSSLDSERNNNNSMGSHSSFGGNPNFQ
ncbi:Protein indeterminate-domain 4, chloroplastic [Linum perenne]